VLAAAAGGPTTPSAGRQEIASIELLLADPVNREIVARYGGSVPSLGDSPRARAVVEHYGADLAGRIQQVSNGLAGVRQAYLQAHLQAYNAAAESPSASSQ
jgi:hypothetical protein